MDHELELETLRDSGVDDADIAQVAKAQEQNRIQQASPDIQPANFLTLQLFNLCSRYWIRAGMEGKPVGLDPLMVEHRASKLRWYQQLDGEAMEWLWDGLDVMANTCLQVWRENNN
jgi:hypothetical protein